MDRAVKCLGAVSLLAAPAYALDVKAWQNIGSSSHGMDFPEESYADVMAKANVGISFSGGGDRAFTASIGYLGGIHEIGLMDNIKYMVGVSGGSWATMVYSYYQDDSVSDATMLGPVVLPADIARADLGVAAPGCVRAYPSTSYQWTSGYTFEDNEDALQYIYLGPSGISRGGAFSYDSATVSDIKARNPALAATTFYTVRGVDGSNSAIDKRPFPIAAATMIGPYDMLPAGPDNREYTILEFTPLSVGVAFTGDITYKEKNGDDTRTLTIGGLVEPYAFGGAASPSLGLGVAERHGRLTVPDPTDSTVIADLALATGASSYAPGCLYAASSLSALQNNVGIHDYFSPSLHLPSSQFGEMALADGAGVQNTNTISLLQRNVRKMILCVNTATPMMMAADWNPATDTLSQDHIDFTIPAMFGHLATDTSTITAESYDLAGSHVFRSDEWVSLAQELQRVQAEGRGIVVSTTHTTVANAKYGIEAGRKVDVVWVYLGRSSVWESQLSAEMKDLVIPESDADNLAQLRRWGPFDGFPHYTTTVASINVERANLLADYTGWIIHEHQSVLQGVIQSGPESESSSEDKAFINTNAGYATIVSAGVMVAAMVVVGLFIKSRGLSKDLSHVDSVLEMNPMNNNI
jgi:hypothetical protein